MARNLIKAMLGEAQEPGQEAQVQVLEEVVVGRTQEMTMRQLELALLVTNQVREADNPREVLLVIPVELKHLSLRDWEIVGNLYETLEQEKAASRIH